MTAPDSPVPGAADEHDRSRADLGVARGLEALTASGVIVLEPPAGLDDDDDQGVLAELIPIGALPLQLPAMGTAPPARDASGLAALLRTAGATDRVLAATGGWLLSERRSSPATQDAYIKEASWWLWWIQARGLDLSDVGFIEADAFAAAMRHAGYANGSRRRRLSALSSWYRYLLRAQAAQRNPFDGMDLPSRKSKITRHVTGAQLHDMLAAFVADFGRRLGADSLINVGEF
ncbi:site-specific integrase [Nonomuraea sp. NPDC046570]|uniref:site-specific integrase n=1 Tax=Nonomuraea sp. NPDC046570 TaxID=3155255 RepID=UPI0033D8EEC4